MLVMSFIMHIFAALFICFRTPFVCLLNNFTELYSYSRMAMYVAKALSENFSSYDKYYVQVYCMGYFNLDPSLNILYTYILHDTQIFKCKGFYFH